MKTKIILLLTLALAGLNGWGQNIVNNKSTIPANWKSYTNDKYGFTFQYPYTWSKRAKDANVINLSGTTMAIVINFIDTVSNTAFSIEYDLAPNGAEQYKFAKAQFDASQGSYATGAKQIEVAGNKAIEAFSTMSSDIKGNTYNPPLRFVNINFLDKQQTGEFALHFKTPITDVNIEIIKLNQLLSSFKFIEPIIGAKEIEMTPTIFGVDISVGNGTVSWSQVYTTNHSFAYIKATEGQSYPPSVTYFNSAITSSNPDGIVLGAYHYARPDNGNTALDEANNFLSNAGSYIGNGYLPPCLDMDEAPVESYLSNGNTTAQLAQWVSDWCTQVYNGTSPHRWPVLYVDRCRANYLVSYYNGVINSNIKLWIADYPETPGNPASYSGCGPDWSSWPWLFHQYFAPGSAGNDPTQYADPGMDQDAFYSTLTDFNNLVGGTTCALTGIYPTLISPGSSSAPGTTITTTTPTLSWNAVTGATNYDVYLSISPYGSSNIVFQQTCVTGTSLAVPSGYLTSGGEYRWNIQANVSCGTCVSNNATPVYFQITSSCIDATVGTQPTNQSITAGNTATFSVTASGTSPFTYQWYKNSSLISGATSSSYTTPTLTTSDNGNTYYCYITNCSGSGNATSNAANLTVTSGCTPVTVSTQPSGQTVTAGNAATFSVSVNGTPPFSYFWYKNGTFQTSTTNTSSTSNSYTTPVLTTGDNGNYYYCLINNCSNLSQVQSINANLTVDAGCTAVSVGTQPYNQSVTTGNTAIFSVIASGTSPFTYQWYKNSSLISGATSSTYTTPTLALSDNGNTYYCYITNCSGSYNITSGSATLTVSSSCTGASVSTQPTSQTTSVGNTATFSVTASGSSPFTYQWYKNSSLISGATSSTYTTPTLASSDNGNTYYCYITNCSGSYNATSNTASLTVASSCTAVSISSQPINQTTNIGSTATFTVAASGTSPFTYQWYKNGSIITGATNYYYTTPTLALSDNGSTYYCYITNCSGSNNYTSNTATLTVSSVCESSEWTWAKSEGGTGGDVENSVAVDALGNIYVAGIFSSPTLTFGSYTLTNKGSNDLFVAKYDANGNVVWAQSAGGTGDDRAYSIAVDTSGNAYVAGYFTSPSISFGSTTFTNPNSYQYSFIVKYNSSGNVVWAKSPTGTGTGSNNAYSVAVDAAGDSYTVGWFNNSTLIFGTITLTNSCSNACGDIFVVKYSANGTVQWAQSAGTTIMPDEAYSVALDNSGNAYVTGFFGNTTIFGTTTLTNTTNATEIFLAKYSSSGAVLWAQSASGEGNIGTSVTTDASGNTYVAGNFGSTSINFGSYTLTNEGSSDLFLAKYNASGTVQWAKSIGGKFNYYAHFLSVDALGNIYMTGYFSSSILTFGSTTLTNVGTDNIFLVKYDANGNVIWAKSAGGTSADGAYSVAVSSSGIVYIAGAFESPTITFGTSTLTNAGTDNIFLAKHAAFEVTVTPTNVSCNGSNNGKALATVVDGGASPFTYLWNTTPAQTAQTATGLIAGNYMVTVTDSLGASYIACVDITQPTPLPVTITPGGFITLCQGNSINLSATSGYNGYLWSPYGETSDTITVDTSGTYYVTVTAANGCTAVSPATVVTIKPLPLAASTIAGVVTVCKGQNSVIYNVPSITNASTYIWSLPNGATGTSSTNSITVNYSTSAISGNISVYGNNLCGDGASSSLYIAVVPTPNAFAGNDTTICNGKNITLNATGGNSYTWNNGVTQGISFTPTSTKTYTVTVSNGFCTATDSVTVSVIIPQPPVIYQSGNTLYSTIPSGNQWYFNNGIITGATSQSYIPTTTGNYSCIETDSNGCHSVASNVLYVAFAGLRNMALTSDNIYVYPNPANDNITIESSAFTKDESISVYDIQGQLLIQQPMLKAKTNIDISAFAKGLYFLKVENENDYAVKKFVKEY